MIEGQDIICFANDWDSDPLSKKHVMQRLAKKNRVLWINSIGNRKPTASVYDLKRMWSKIVASTKGHRQVGERIYVYSPIAIPFFGNPVARWLNQRLLRGCIRRTCRTLGFNSPVMWTFFPSSGNIAGTLGERMVVYHCVDEYSEFTGTDKAAILKLERELIDKCDYVFVSSERLYETKKDQNPNTFLITHGVDVNHFRKACAPETVVPAEMSRLQKPVIGFFGLIADWVDFEIIRAVAVARPDCSVALIGKVSTDLRLVEGLNNVHVLGQKSYAELPGFAKAFDIAILPFVINELTLAANPLKLREYVAAGLPIVASAIPEAERLKDVVRIARNKAEFIDHVNAILASGRVGPQLEISTRMDAETWDAKVEEMSRIVAGSKKTAA